MLAEWTHLRSMYPLVGGSRVASRNRARYQKKKTGTRVPGIPAPLLREPGTDHQHAKILQKAEERELQQARKTNPAAIASAAAGMLWSPDAFVYRHDAVNETLRWRVEKAERTHTRAGAGRRVVHCSPSHRFHRSRWLAAHARSEGCMSTVVAFSQSLSCLRTNAKGSGKTDSWG